MSDRRSSPRAMVRRSRASLRQAASILLAVSLLGLLLVAISSVVSPTRARAADLGQPPDAQGNWAHCIVNITHQVSPGTSVYWWYSCQFAPTINGNTVTSLGIQITADGSQYTTGVSWDTSHCTPPSAYVCTYNADGLFRESVPPSGVTDTTFSSVSVISCNVGTTYNNGAPQPCSATAVSAGDGYPPYPLDWWTGGIDGNAQNTGAAPYSTQTAPRGRNRSR